MLTSILESNFEGAEIAHKTLVSSHWAEFKEYNPAIKTVLQFK